MDSQIKYTIVTNEPHCITKVWYHLTEGIGELSQVTLENNDFAEQLTGNSEKNCA